MFKKIAIQYVAFSIMILAAIALPSSALAASPTEADIETAHQINAANQLLLAGEIDSAIAQYGSVSADRGNRDTLNYNMAVAQYRKSDIQAAVSLFKETAGSSDRSIAARSRFNLGNCLFATALQTAEQDKPAAIEQLRQAISHYRGSLRSMPDNDDARANIELAVEMIRQLDEEQKQLDEQQKQEDEQQNQNQDQQNQDQQNQDQQDQDQQNQDQQNQDQQNQDQQNQDQQNQDQQNQDRQDQDQENQDQQNQDQDGQGSQSQESQPKDQSDQSESDKPNEQPEPDDKTEQESQQAHSQDQRQPNENSSQSPASDRHSSQDEAEPEEGQAADQQPVPTGELTAAEDLDDSEPNGTVGMSNPNTKEEGAMTKEEALKMLQAVRDRDMLRRLQQQQRERSRHVPVDRDW